MNCNLSNDYLMRYFDNNLNDIEHAHLKQHLKVCKKCNTEFEELKEVFKVLEGEDVIEPPQDFELQVMSKINSLELVRKKRLDKFLIFLYSIASGVLIVMSMLLVASISDFNLIKAIQHTGESISSFSNAVFASYSVVKAIYSIITGIAGALFQISVIIIKTYYYIFAILLVMLLLVQKMFLNVAGNNDGGMG